MDKNNMIKVAKRAGAAIIFNMAGYFGTTVIRHVISKTYQKLMVEKTKQEQKTLEDMFAEAE